jgi:uncharacterized protein (TIGR02145 family)
MGRPAHREHMRAPFRVPGALRRRASLVMVVAAALGSGFTATGSKPVPSKPMADGKQWTVENLNVDTAPSYCYDDAELNCRRFGRLYTWESAQRACRSLGEGWRLPTENEWNRLATHHGGVSEDAKDRGRAAYSALLTGGRAGLDAVLGGGRSAEGAFARIEAHGFYWTASESGPATVWFYNFGKRGQALHRQREGDKQEAFSVRCVRE